MPRILVIDDDAAVRHVITRILQRAGHDVLSAADGRQGLAMLDRNPDVIVTDIIMPNMEGIETIREIRRVRPTAKIIAISGGGRHGTMDFLELAEKFGASETLGKPFDPASLVQAIERCTGCATAFPPPLRAGRAS